MRVTRELVGLCGKHAGRVRVGCGSRLVLATLAVICTVLHLRLHNECIHVMLILLLRILQVVNASSGGGLEFPMEYTLDEES